MRNKIIVFLLLCISLIFSGCFSSWQEETGTIILNLGSNSRATLPPSDEALDKLEYEVTFTGANDEFTLDSVGSQPVKTTVASGEWKITVKAFENVINPNKPTESPKKIMYAIGKETVKVKPGKSNPVTVKMSNMATVDFYINAENINKYNNEIEKYISYKIECNDGYNSNNITISDIKGHHRIESGIWTFHLMSYLNGSFINFEDSSIEIRINPGDNDVVFTPSYQVNEEIPYVIIINPDPNGKGSVATYSDNNYCYQITYAYNGEIVYIEAIPNEKYPNSVITRWEILPQVITIDDYCFFMPPSNVTITPHFLGE